MNLIPLKSKRLNPGDNLFIALEKSLGKAKEKLKEGDILVIASKAVSFHQNRFETVKSKSDFKKLIKKEADKVLDEGEMVLTLKNRILIPNAGIDNSNTPGNLAVLWPKEPFGDARDIQTDLKKTHKLKKLGVLISDSHCHPLRLGTAGIAIGWAGFEGVEDERGSKDLFGKKMHYTRIAVADNLASAANLLMGETNASIPFVIVRDFKVKWTSKKAAEKDYFISPKECLYRSLYSQKLKKA